MDCSITKNYLKELCRMSNGCAILCKDCLLDMKNNRSSFNCITFQGEYPEEAIKIVQKWSDEHPVITRLEKYEQVIKDVFGEELDIEYDDCPPVPCDGNKNCEQCKKWWNEPYEER